VDGKILVQDGRAVHVDEEAVYAQASQATHHFWRQVPTWHWGGYALEQIIPPAFPMHRASTVAG
jgi:hypothetical protein